MNPYEIRRVNLRARLRQAVVDHTREDPCARCAPHAPPLSPAACACGAETSCPSCVNAKEAEGYEHVADLMERRQWRWADGTYNAPPLSPAEQATVDRFDTAPDPWGDE